MDEHHYITSKKGKVAQLNAKLHLINYQDRFFGTALMDTKREGHFELYAELTRILEEIKAEIESLNGRPRGIKMPTYGTYIDHMEPAWGIELGVPDEEGDEESSGGESEEDEDNDEDPLKEARSMVFTPHTMFLSSDHSCFQAFLDVAQVQPVS